MAGVSKTAIEKLEALESRVRGLVEMVQELKRSNAALQTELRAARERLLKQEETAKRWDAERGDIKGRIHRVLEELDYLDSLDDASGEYSEASARSH